MKKITKFLQKNGLLILLFLSTFLITGPLFQPGYFSHHDDLQIMRVFEMRKCIQDFQIPCRWVPDMGYGNGYPMFNYYGVFPYYLGAILSIFLGYIGAVKALFYLALVLGVFGMYLLGSELFGSELGFLAAVIYEFAPYRALDSYVRGDIDETMAISIIPFCLYFSLKLIKKKSLNNVIFFTLSLAAFLTTHNISIMLFTPVLIVWIAFWVWKRKQKIIWPLVLGFILAVGLATFFLVPAFFEKGLVQTDNLISLDLNFRAHFVTVSQLFIDRVWGYGASVLGDKDTISFQIGWPLWGLVLISFLVVVFKYLTTKTKNLFFFFLLSIWLFSIFMTHNKSAFIWEKIPLLAYVQFPWRFLGITIFIGSLLAVWWIQYFPSKARWILIWLITLVTITLNLSFFVPEKFFPNMTDGQKLSGIEWETQQKAAILDYLPNGANKPTEVAQPQPFVISGIAKVNDFRNYTNHFQFNVVTSEQSLIEIPIFDFPNWETKVDGVKITHSNQNYLKRMDLTLGPGNYRITGKLQDTPIRVLANITTLISLALLFFFCANGKVRKRFS